MPQVPSEDCAAIARSEFFDADWYLARYPDVAMLGMDPAEHYLWLGARLGRDPSPAFSTRGYIAANPDVAAAGCNPLLHYVQQGRFENREAPDATYSAPWLPSRKVCVERSDVDLPAELPARPEPTHLSR